MSVLFCLMLTVQSGLAQEAAPVSNDPETTTEQEEPVLEEQPEEIEEKDPEATPPVEEPIENTEMTRSAVPEATVYEKPIINYASHIQDIGWQNAVKEGNISGTQGKAKRMEAFILNVENAGGYDIGFKYAAHVMNIGWQNAVTTGQIAGTTGKGLRMEAVQIELTGADADKFDVYYQVHAQNFGDMGWAKNGESAGTAGFAYRLESIKIVLQTKGAPAPGPTDRAYFENPKLTYQTHVQDIGWQNYVEEGMASGTRGQAKRMEAAVIKFAETYGLDIGVQYQSHVQDVGWQNYVNSGSISGTQGQSKRLEAMRIKLTGSDAVHFDIYYCTHIQDFGDLDWAKNGESSGSEGYSKRLESITIRLVAKGSPAPGATSQTFFKKGDYPNTHRNTGNRRHDIMAVAATQIGYQEGGDGYSKYGHWYEKFMNNDPSYRTEEWCAIFISWCAEQANVPSSIVPVHDWCHQGYGFYQRQGRFRYNRTGYVPKSGDIIYFNWGHTGFVTSCDGVTVHTLEGNTTTAGNGREGVRLKAHALNSSSIYGYGIPNY